jgi:membrane protease YdiL (CAAX protease family)
VIALSTTIEYGIYAAYRDARMLNGQKRYSYRMPIDSLGDLMSASFERSIIKKPQVWGGLLGCLALAVGTSSLFYPGEAEIKMSLVSRMGSPWIAFPIAVREESLFRGFLQSTLTEATNPWGGIALSSLLFGAAHIGNAQRLPKEHQWRYYAFSLPLITTLGAYFGWITHKNCSLKESVAVHAWYDFTLFAADLLARQVGAIDQTGFAMDIPF